jgi:hypothetical protein
VAARPLSLDPSFPGTPACGRPPAGPGCPLLARPWGRWRLEGRPKVGRHIQELVVVRKSRLVWVLIYIYTHDTRSLLLMESFGLRPSSWNCLRRNHYNKKIISFIQHHQLNKYSQDLLQATSVTVENTVRPQTISALYLPPKHTFKQEQLEDFYSTLEHRFIA